MTIWRLSPGYGIRQSIWMVLIGVLLVVLLNTKDLLIYLRRYKYLWLASGLIITSLTFILGVNPLGGGARLWLGCCGLYFQPSEFLKFLLIVYLSSYFAERVIYKLNFISLIVPTLLVIGLTLSILIFQRDLGTASIFFLLYATLLFFTTGNKKILIPTLLGISLAGSLGYLMFDVIRLRVTAWLNPWIDPSGRSFQIVQSLMAFASGGLFGRGPGVGNPGLVPVAISDFIFSAIGEEFGLVGSLIIISFFLVIAYRGLLISLKASDRFQRFLALGLTVYLIIQTILITGGNLRLLPLTGVTLPFISYGGSSLLTSFVSILILLIISNNQDKDPQQVTSLGTFKVIAATLTAGLILVSLTNGWWSIIRGPDLLLRSDNARRSISDRYVKRGSILARQDQPITITQGFSGDFLRIYKYPALSPLVGYTHPIFGQAGLELSMDEYLRGNLGNPSSLIWWDHLLYGQPPPGLDIRLSIDLDLQKYADQLLGDSPGAVVLLNANSGEILTMASHPFYDPSNLDISGDQVQQDVNQPLINRAAQGSYPAGDVINLFLSNSGLSPNSSKDAKDLLFRSLGFYSTPETRIPVSPAVLPNQALRLSPLQLVLAAASLSNQGVCPAPRLVMAFKNHHQGWVTLPALTEPSNAMDPKAIESNIQQFSISGKPVWEFTSRVLDPTGRKNITWYLSGTQPAWKGTPLVLVVVLESDDTLLAKSLGQALLDDAMNIK